MRGRLRVAASRVLAMLRRGTLDREVDAELESHVQMAIDDNVRRGMRLNFPVLVDNNRS